ncbi:MAG: 1-acyl-sn-glycerol-3-phosphate acyltransferase [Leptolyngbya sp. RL_3_1]|nr:1-acyl-sn-glycerol-3-phosphate acyltransferase [Leptolyngbya sp. RL_3_1]
MVLAGAKRLLPVWMKQNSSIKSVETKGVEELVRAFQAFQAGEVRFMIAFRHPSADDAYCLMRLLWHDVPRVARQMGVTFSAPIHSHFIYDRGIPLWAGRWVGWLYAKLGGTPIQRGKVDRPGLKSARSLFAQGQFPLAAAPEGGNNGHTEIVSPLEPGIAQFGFWCVEDLQKAQRPEQVMIIPLGIRYKYLTPPWGAIAQLLRTLEQDLGLDPAPELTPPTSSGTAEIITQLYPRLLRLGRHLLARMEAYYADFYHRPLPESEQNIDTLDGTALAKRLQALLDTALQVAESFFKLPGKGNTIDRCRRIEQAGWDWIYRQELSHPQQLSAVDQGLADRVAEEAALRMWHMRLVEGFVAVTGQYVSQKPTVERFAETLLLVRDTITLIKGESPFPRPQLGPQVAQLTVGAPISVSDRWDDYRQGRRQAVANLTEALQMALQGLIAA